MEKWYAETPNPAALAAAKYFQTFGVPAAGWDVVLMGDENFSEPPLGAEIYDPAGNVVAYGVGETGAVLKHRTEPETPERVSARIEGKKKVAKEGRAVFTAIDAVEWDEQGPIPPSGWELLLVTPEQGVGDFSRLSNGREVYGVTESSPCALLGYVFGGSPTHLLRRADPASPPDPALDARRASAREARAEAEERAPAAEAASREMREPIPAWRDPETGDVYDTPLGVVRAQQERHMATLLRGVPCLTGVRPAVLFEFLETNKGFVLEVLFGDALPSSMELKEAARMLGNYVEEYEGAKWNIAHRVADYLDLLAG
jgi:hypothetical protein